MQIVMQTVDMIWICSILQFLVTVLATGTGRYPRPDPDPGSGRRTPMFAIANFLRRVLRLARTVGVL